MAALRGVIRATGLALALLSAPAVILAATQSNEQQSCLNAFNKAGAKVAATQGKENAACVAGAGKGKVADAHACLGADAKGKVSKARAKTEAEFLKKCATLPDFGLPAGTVTAAVNNAAVEHSLRLVGDVLGDDLTAAVVDCGSNPDGCKCQAAAVKDYEKVAATELKEFLGCKKSTLAAGAESVEELAACVTPGGIAADAKGKIAKAVAKLSADIGKRCAENVFPGYCSEEPVESLGACIAERVSHRVCRTIEDMDGLDADCGVSPEPTPLPDPVWTLGEQQTLLAANALGGLCYFPDMATVRVPGISPFRLLTEAGICKPGSYVAGTYLFEGADIEHLQSARLVMSHGGPGEFDNGYAGISGLYRHTDGRLYGFYHAEDQEGLPLIPGTAIPGYYASIAVAVSDDDGESWTKLGQVVTSARPKEFAAYPGHNARGAAEPGVVADPDGRYLFIHYSDHSLVAADGSFRGLQVAAARADLSEGPPIPGRWWKYYQGEFSEPGIGGEEDIVLNASQLLPFAAYAYEAHATFSAYLGRYVMVTNVVAVAELSATTPSLTGLYIAFSDDALTWSRPEQLVVDFTTPTVGKSLSWESNIVWDDDSGQKGWLVYGHTPNWGTIGHYMVGRRIEFQ